MIKLLIAAALLAAQAAGAQTIWRCGNSYSTTPCAGGSTVQAQEPRPAEDVQAAQGVADRERQLADRLRAEREQRESAVSGGLAGIRDHRQAKAETKPLRKPQKLKKQHPPEDAGTWRATVPASPRARG
jgi:hypothetical protein